MTAEETLENIKSIVRQWIEKQGHDRCWYYPEVFEKVADLLGIKNAKPTYAMPRSEFEEGCKRFQDQQAWLTQNSIDSTGKTP